MFTLKFTPEIIPADDQLPGGLIVAILRKYTGIQTIKFTSV